MRIRHTLIALLAVGLMATPARAEEADKPGDNEDPKAGSNTAAAIMAAQAPLTDAATRLSEVDREGGLGGIRLEVPKRALYLWWKGDPPGAIREEISRLQAELRIRIVVQESKFSQRELVEVAHEIGRRWDEYPGLTRIGPRVDGSGLEVGAIEPAALSPEMFPVPVVIVQDYGMQQTSRFDDSPPWWAGAVTRPIGSTFTRCSTGFAAARYFLGFETARGILTAEHCAPGGGVNFVDGPGQVIGMAEPAPPRDYLSDSLFIRTNAAPRMFDGGVGVGEFSKPVVGWVGNFAGQFVCTSGAATGVHCNIRTDSTHNMVRLFPSGSLVISVVLGTEQAGTVATGLGDSGGPVFTLAANHGQVKAAGLMSGALNVVPCQIPGQSACFNRVGFVDIGYVMISQGVSILVQ